MWFQHLSETEIILAVLAVFYLSECVFWISHQAVCFSAMAANFRPDRGVGFVSNDNGGLVPTVPTPFATSFVCESWPVSVSPEGIYAAAEQTGAHESSSHRAGTFVSFTGNCSIKLLDREVCINGKPIARFTSASHARCFREFLDEVSASTGPDRERAIEEKLKAMTDIDAIKQRLSMLRCEAAPLKVASTILFLYTFGLGALLYYLAETGSAYHLWVYLGGFAAYWLFAVLTFYSAHRRLYPNCVAERRKCCATMILSPAAAMRGPSLLSRNLLASYHPVAAAAVVCSQQMFLEFAKPFLLDLQYSMPIAACAENSASLRTEQWFRARLRIRLCEVLRCVGLDAADLVKPPAPDPDARSYCPRCQSQFVLDDGTCENCGGLRLKRFGKHLNETPSDPVGSVHTQVSFEPAGRPSSDT